MRRKEREITDFEKIDSILQAGKICRLGFGDPTSPAPYLLPLNYGYEWQQEAEGERPRLRLVFHGAKAGRKYTLLQHSPVVGFVVDCGYEPIGGDTACQHSCLYQSLVGWGRALLVEDTDDKKQAINLLMTCQAGHTFPIEEKVLAQTAVFEVLVEEYSAKGHERH